MHTQSSKYARNLLAVARDDNDWLSETQRIEHGIRCSLRQSLDPQISVGRYLAHDIAGFIDRRRNQPVRRATADSSVNVRQIVGRGMKVLESFGEGFT